MPTTNALTANASTASARRRSLLAWVAFGSWGGSLGAAVCLGGALSVWSCSSHAAGDSAKTPPAADASIDGGDASACAVGFQSSPDAEGCTPILPPAACEAGSGPSIGSAACAPVGPASCPQGFVPHASGWGCDAVLPEPACTGATIETIGSATCAPLGDCSAPFPPADATIFVSASYTASQLDATHYQAVDAALANAPNGAVIAVDVGNYTGTMAPTLDVSIVGRCAASVVFQASQPMTSALEVQGGVVSLSNVTLTGYDGAVSLLGGTTTLDAVVVEASTYVGIAVGNTGTRATLNQVVVRGTREGPTDTNGFGLFVAGGASATVTASVFADNDYINVAVAGAGTPGASLSLASSVVRDGHPVSATVGFGWGIYASEKTSLTVTDSAVVDNVGFGMSLFASTTKDAPKGVVTGTVIRGTTLDAVNGAGFGMETTESSADVEGTTIADSALVDLYVADGSTAKLAGSALVGTSSTDPTVLGPIGLVVHGSTADVSSVAIAGTRAGAELEATTTATITSSIVSGTRTSPMGYYVGNDYVGVGLFEETDAHLTLDGTAIVGTHTAGLLALGHTTATGLLVQGTRAGGDGVGGRGVSAQSGATVSFEGSAFLDNSETGVLVAVGGASLVLSDSVVDQTQLDPSGMFGIGVLVDDGVVGTITRTTLSRSAGPALAVSAGSAAVQSCVFADNSIAVFVQDGTSLVAGADAGPMTLDISSDTVFVGNQTRVGSGMIAIPVPLTSP